MGNHSTYLMREMMLHFGYDSGSIIPNGWRDRIKLSMTSLLFVDCVMMLTYDVDEN